MTPAARWLLASLALAAVAVFATPLGPAVRVWFGLVAVMALFLTDGGDGPRKPRCSAHGSPGLR